MGLFNIWSAKAVRVRDGKGRCASLPRHFTFYDDGGCHLQDGKVLFDGKRKGRHAEKCP